jgi:hypothetical protein
MPRSRSASRPEPRAGGGRGRGGSVVRGERALDLLPGLQAVGGRALGAACAQDSRVLTAMAAPSYASAVMEETHFVDGQAPLKPVKAVEGGAPSL